MSAGQQDVLVPTHPLSFCGGKRAEVERGSGGTERRRVPISLCSELQHPFLHCCCSPGCVGVPHAGIWSLCCGIRVVRGSLAGTASGQRQYSARPVLILLIGMNSSKRQQMAAKAGETLSVGRKYTQVDPSGQLTWPRARRCPDIWEFRGCSPRGWNALGREPVPPSPTFQNKCVRLVHLGVVPPLGPHPGGSASFLLTRGLPPPRLFSVPLAHTAPSPSRPPSSCLSASLTAASN